VTVLDLAADQLGEAGVPVVILHGLMGSARNWTSIARQLVESHRVLTVDLRNHGRSPWAKTMGFDEMAGDVAAAVEGRDLAPAVLVGHSLGGKVAMRLALTRAELVARLVVVDVAPVLYVHSLRAYVDAMRAIDLAKVTRRPEVEAELAKTIHDPLMRAFLLQNLVRTSEGYVWRANLEAIVANLPDLMGFPDSAGLSYRGPTLFIAGSRSTYVRTEHRPVIKELFPEVEFLTIAGAGHQVHADRPDEFLAAVVPFVA
jgi:esterase